MIPNPVEKLNSERIEYMFFRKKGNRERMTIVIKTGTIRINRTIQ